jgi:hypothetical protein
MLTAITTHHGPDTHECEHCTAAGALEPAAADAARALGLEPGALLCASCTADATADAETMRREAAALAARYLDTVARHPTTVTLALRLPRIAALMAAGMLLAACDHAELSDRADAVREAWIAGLEAESDLPPPQPWSSAFDPAVDGLCTAVAA